MIKLDAEGDFRNQIEVGALLEAHVNACERKLARHVAGLELCIDLSRQVHANSTRHPRLRARSVRGGQDARDEATRLRRENLARFFDVSGPLSKQLTYFANLAHGLLTFPRLR